MATAKVLELIEKARKAHAERLAKQTALVAAKPLGPNGLNSASSVNTKPESNLITQIVSKQYPQATQIDDIVLNKEQADAVERGMRGQSFVLIGPAGSGKTTNTQYLIKMLPRASHVLPFKDSTKHLVKDSVGIVIVGYTNKSVNNIRKKLPAHLQGHCMTLHKLLEYAPVYYTVFDEEGVERNTMRFEPSRNGANCLPHVSTVILEESSMIGTELFGQLLDALPRPAATQFIFLGDIYQLPPVFGPSILGFKLSELPVVELTQIYRQALLSPIISLATAIRTNEFTPWLSEQSGQIGQSVKKLNDKLVIDSEAHGKVTINPWKKRIAAPSALKTIVNMVCNLIASNQYNPEEDQILCPFNKAMGTIELNKGIADFLTKKRNGITHEVIARFTRSYWSVDDRVLVDRHDGVILKIEPTIGYAGKPPRAASTTLDRSGYDPVLDGDAKAQRSAEDILNELDAIAEADKDESKNLASHTITVWIPDLGEERKLTTAGEINAMLLSYALTVHKSQGSEWRRVFLFLHHSHQTMCSRELLYTAITRAKEELYVICEGDIAPYKSQLLTGSNRAVIPGVTLAEKIEYFTGKAASMKKLDCAD
jgi:exodeoxyribonuclease V alpha subunit